MACMENKVVKAKQVKKEGMEVWGGIFMNLLLNTLRSVAVGGHNNAHLWYQD
ncbi:hypothetical protein EV421DRAFT_1907611 [Armillaria borealis]|uniref:Uncharacterized protein n=1 Tax=Armillaria borealis TaxID=47425 RepID=A0AA39J6Q3_9AGAR|nr:hypothetical protein EV421DRAFT_1907611 [Armillaria borealis]